MAHKLGISQDGLKAALNIKESYDNGQLILIPGEGDRVLIPEVLMNDHIDLLNLDDPLPLAVMAVQDPETPMALAATARFSPKGGLSPLLAGISEIIADTSRHALVKECLHYIQERSFEPTAIAEIRDQTSKFIIRTRQQYTADLRENLKNLMDGTIAPRQFVCEFFELTEAGNMRHDIRKKLVLSLLLSSTVRPSVKFLMLENLERMPGPVQAAIFSAVMSWNATRHVEMVKDEIRYMIISKNQQKLH